MRLNKLKSLTQRKVAMLKGEKAPLREEREKTIIAIAHEIRNPLTAIKLTNQFMREAFDKQERDQLLMQSYMMIIANNVERIEKHLAEVLTYRKTPVTLVPINISGCIEKALFEAKDRLFLSGISLTNECKGNYWVYGSEEKLVTAFLNIIINAIEATSNRNGRIWISAYKTHNTVRVTFKDNGTGMDPATAKRIFDADFSTKDGIGIGMYNVKEIVDLHRANIIADSLPGVGTSISILFHSIPEAQIPERSKRASGPVAGDH